MSYFASTYAACVESGETEISAIKWSADLKRKAKNKKNEPFDEQLIDTYHYRPFAERHLYESQLFIDRKGPLQHFFRENPSLEVKISF